jgi:hypothetical protein
LFPICRCDSAPLRRRAAATELLLRRSAAVTQSDVWSLTEQHAQLRLGDLEATLDIAHPSHGLYDIRVRGRLIGSASLLAPCFPGQDPLQALAVADCFVRGGDLVATYAQVHARPVRLQVYWRARAAKPGEMLAAIDVQVSVQTSLLEAYPALVLQSRLPTRTVTCLSAIDPNRQRSRTDAAATQAESAGCWLCHLPTADVVYGEMFHPADVERETLVVIDEQSIELVHHLFTQPLEKGVILRARARGVFAPSDAAQSAIASAYAEFLSAPLPLTT